MAKTTLKPKNYNDGKTPIWAEIIRWALKAVTVLIPVFGGRIGLTPMQMTELSVGIIGLSESLKMFSIK